MAKRHSRKWWFARVAELPGTGLTHRQYAKSLGVALGTLQHWIYLERREQRQAQVPALVEVQWQTAQVEPAEPAQVHAVVGGVKLAFEQGTDAAWLAELLGCIDRQDPQC